MQSAFGPSPHDPRFGFGHQGMDANAQNYYMNQAMQYAMNNPNNVFAQEQARAWAQQAAAQAPMPGPHQAVPPAAAPAAAPTISPLNLSGVHGTPEFH